MNTEFQISNLCLIPELLATKTYGLYISFLGFP